MESMVRRILSSKTPNCCLGILNAGFNQLSWTHNHVTATISFSSSMQPSAVQYVNSVQCSMRQHSALCHIVHHTVLHWSPCTGACGGVSARRQWQSRAHPMIRSGDANTQRYAIFPLQQLKTNIHILRHSFHLYCHHSHHQYHPWFTLQLPRVTSRDHFYGVQLCPKCLSKSQNHILLRQFTIYFNSPLNFKRVNILSTRSNGIRVIFTAMCLRVSFDGKISESLKKLVTTVNQSSTQISHLRKSFLVIHHCDTWWKEIQYSGSIIR